MGGGRVAPDLPPESIQPEQPATRPGRGNRVAPASVPSTEDSSSRPGGGPSAAPSSRPPSARPVQAAWEPSAAEKRLEAHGEVYIPFRAAKAKVNFFFRLGRSSVNTEATGGDSVAEVQADMEAMKHQHMQIVNELEGHYKVIFAALLSCYVPGKRSSIPLLLPLPLPLDLPPLPFSCSFFLLLLLLRSLALRTPLLPALAPPRPLPSLFPPTSLPSPFLIRLVLYLIFPPALAISLLPCILCLVFPPHPHRSNTCAVS
eukprot:31289-Rhodomonas_salina.1